MKNGCDPAEEGKLPKTTGIWEEIYYHVYRLRKSEKRRKKKLSTMIDQLRQSTEALPDAAIVLGINDEIDWTNKAARNILVYYKLIKDSVFRTLSVIPNLLDILKQVIIKNLLFYLHRQIIELP